MASATMGLRRRVPVNNSPSPASHQSTTSASKRSRSENNNNPSHGNLNSLSGRDEPVTKKSRGTSGLSGRANASGSTSNVDGNHGSKRTSGSKSRAKSPQTSSSVTSVVSTNASMARHEADLSGGFNVLTSSPWPVPTTLSAMSGLSVPGGQSSLCGANLTMPPTIPYMATSMATFVGNATNLSKNSSVSYLDISNMTSGSLGNSSASGINGYGSSACSKPSAVPEAKSTVPLAFSGVVPSPGMSYNTSKLAAQPSDNVNVPKFQNDGMFNAYQPWVIKTYGDLAKTKTITIKKYARILRTLRGEEVNSAENSKFRFWVKSKGFHIGQPEGYDAKPADRIIGRHAVTSPGLDPPLYVPTQLPHNKALNGAEGTVPGKVFKKVAIVENFFDIIHAVHVDLEGRPGKHAGQKRTYRTITETYAFLPREAVTRFLLGCTECQRRPRTPSPSNLPNQSQAAAVTSTSVVGTTTGTVTRTPRSPTPATALSASPTQSILRPREASNPPESKSLFSYRHPKHHRSAVVSSEKVDKDKEVEKEKEKKKDKEKEKDKEEKYNPLSISNLLKKEPSNSFTSTSENLVESRSTPESDRASSRSSASSKRKRMLPEGRTPSPTLLLPLPRPWSPGLDPKDTPVDYSLPITTTYLKHQQKILAEKNKAAAAAALEEAQRKSPVRETQNEDKDRFSPAAGLIDTNLNLLATIQHLHCQVMMALTERLRPSGLPTSLMLPPSTPVMPTGFIAPDMTFSPAFTHHQS
ncbi:uncharacterized protein [Chelonus insularis]|uniref:uncharacterized protein n=1 Tax=Chelonus insularis TaxID=460826 RepID=UPI001589FD8E|nr:uncharacterized protein LOC118069145 [Chelonus insularis]XP_034942921.1 uncharacterized protein LOC118069145 [Chelonus insularis]XP_034942922.1 uncharacterized protein LOC118069145 [Chelonus insularis]